MKPMMRSILGAVPIVCAVAVLLTIALSMPAQSSVTQKSGSPFLFDDSTGKMVGIKQADGTESFFPLYTTLASATATAAFTPAVPGAIGGTTPAAGAFTTLTATSTLAVTGTATFSGIVTAASSIQTGTTTVASLATCNGAASGKRHFVTDATTTTFAATATGSGSSIVPVFCDGTSWKIG